VQYQRGNSEDAEQAVRMALDLVSSRASSEGSAAAVLLKWTQSARQEALFLLAVLLVRRNAWDEGARVLRELLQMMEAPVGGVSVSNPRQHAMAHLLMSITTEYRGTFSEALEHAERALPLSRQLYDAADQETDARDIFRLALETAAGLRRAIGDEAGARAAEAELAALADEAQGTR
jgi:hypothetical protein